MSEQVPQRDRALRCTQQPLAVGVDREHPRVAERRHHARRRCVEVERAAFNQLNRGDRRDRLGHRGEPHHGIGRHRNAVVQRAFAEGAFVERRFAVRSHGHDARHRAGGDRVREQPVYPYL